MCGFGGVFLFVSGINMTFAVDTRLPLFYYTPVFAMP